MSKKHPITPPPELVRQWDEECDSRHNPEIDNTFDALKCFASKAAQWGSDQELEACCEWVEKTIPSWAPHTLNEQLRNARRPEPPSLKEQALLAIDVAVADGRLSPDVSNVVRRALEQLD